MRIILTDAERVLLTQALAAPLAGDPQPLWSVIRSLMPNCPETDHYVLHDVFRAILDHAEPPEKFERVTTDGVTFTTVPKVR